MSISDQFCLRDTQTQYYYSPEQRTLDLNEDNERQDLVIQNSDINGALNLFEGILKILCHTNCQFYPYHFKIKSSFGHLHNRENENFRRIL